MAGPLFVAAFTLDGANRPGYRAFDGATGLVDIGGLIQRVTIVIGWGWLMLLAVHLLRESSRRQGVVLSIDHRP